jgi:hypothetical protein
VAQPSELLLSAADAQVSSAIAEAGLICGIGAA